MQGNVNALRRMQAEQQERHARYARERAEATMRVVKDESASFEDDNDTRFAFDAQAEFARLREQIEAQQKTWQRNQHALWKKIGRVENMLHGKIEMTIAAHPLAVSGKVLKSLLLGAIAALAPLAFAILLLIVGSDLAGRNSATRIAVIAAIYAVLLIAGSVLAYWMIDDDG